MYRTIRTILRYDMIHTIRTLYHTIHEQLRYTDTIRNFLHTIRYVLYDTDNYGWESPSGFLLNRIRIKRISGSSSQEDLI